MGIRRMKEGYKPQPYHRRTREGKHAPTREIPRRAADYLARYQWAQRRETGGGYRQRKGRWGRSISQK